MSMLTKYMPVRRTGRQTLFWQTLLRQTLFRQSTVRTTQYVFSTCRLGTCRNSRNWEKIGGGRGVACMHRKHVIDPGTEVTEGSGAWGVGRVFCWGLRCPLLRKSYEVSPRLQHNCTAPYTPDFRNLVRLISNRYCPQAYSTAVSHPTSTSRLDCQNSVCRNSVVYPGEPMMF